jgi:eukaryotic-like serine/threonine-protein kinase
MNTERLRRLRGLLGTALGLAPEQRPDFVARAAADDAELGAEVVSLLAAAEREDPGLEPPLVASAVAPEPVAGDRLGAWRLDRRIGAGGMGEVWLATRADGGFAQRVAVKVPRAVGHGPGAFARFERERSLLAELEDPGVARLVDGGWTADGRPWLAMEFVQGLPIDQHADARGLDRRARVRLVLAACRALASAHRRRIVHRDLKPGNVLVRDDGEVVLVDFGIAAVLDGATGLAVGALATPRYAAPEQLRGAAVTTSADVYALAVLCRDLVGPCDEDLAAVLAAASHADPERRTPTADAFAAELQRWLAHRPVDARPPTPWRRLCLWWRRAPGAAATVLLLIALAAGLGITSTVLWQAERSERQRAAAANVDKERRLTQVRALVRELVFGVHDRIAALPDAVPVRAFVVACAERHLTELAAAAADDPALAREWIELQMRLADVRGARTYGHHGDLEGALQSARASVASAAAWRARRPTDTHWRLLEAKGHRQLGDLLRAVGDTAAARAAYDHTLDLVAGIESRAAPECSRLAAVTRLQRARLDLDAGEFAAGIADLQAARQQLEAMAETAPDLREAGRDAALAHSTLGFALSQLGREADAAAAWAEALRRLEALLVVHPHDAQLRRERIEVELELAFARAHERRNDASERFEKALNEARAHADSDASNVLAQRLLHRALLRGARFAELRGALPRCADFYREVEPMLRAALQHYGGDRSVRTDLAEALIARAEADRRRGVVDGVAAAYEEGVVLLEAEAALAAGDHLAGNLLTMAWVGLGRLALDAGDAATARTRFDHHRAATAAWADRHAALPWPLRHLCALEHGLGTANELLAQDPALTPATRLEHLGRAQDAFARGLAAAQRLADEGRLHGLDKALPVMLQTDVQRVAAAARRLGAAGR